MKLYGVRIWVKDMPAAKQFYGQTLGLAVLWDYGSAVGYDLGAQLIVEQDDESESYAGRFVGCSIAVQDVYATYERLLSAGVHFVEPPEKQPWGGVLAHFKDPDGNVLTLVG